jgi:DNA excision repair protein ERCC-2
MKTQLAVGVRELVEHVLRSGDLVMEFAGSSRAAEAIRIHQRIQYSRPDGYVPEVSVARRVETDDFVLEIGGRIDGVFAGPGIPVVEEIKTTRRSLEESVRSDNPLHWGQAKVYAFLYGVDRGIGDIGVQLTYARLDTGATREVRRQFTLAELSAFFDELVACYLRWASVITQWRRERDTSLGDLSFPYATYRPGQEDMAQTVDRTIRAGGRTFIQAATGIGKTMAVLFPAVKTIADGGSDKIFYLTARTTGRLAAEKALDELRTRGLRLKRLTLTAKEKICFTPDGACNPEECDYARGHFDRLPEARRAMFQEDAWTREAVSAAARRFRVCPFEFSLDLSLWADAVIGDYNYAFDPQAYLRRFFLEETAAYTFLVDEAHNLVERAREMFSAELGKQPVLDLRRAVKDALPALYRRLGRINRWMLAARKRCEEAAAPIADRAPPEELLPLLREFLQAAEQWLEKNVKSPFREALLEFYFASGNFLRVADQFDEAYATCTEALPHDLRLRLFCIDPSRQIGEAINRCRSAVFFSATLAPMDYFKTMLGCDRADDLVLPSPFPAENLGVFVCDRVSTLYRHRDRTKAEIARILQTFVDHTRGNSLLFFPSYQYMRMVLEAFRSAGAGTDVIVQEPGMSERQREGFLGRFETDNPRTLVGFAVMGGIFGEGIDLVGTRLSAAAVVGVGLPAVCLERELIREYFTTRLEQGFEYAYMYPGINRVLQAAGRVIRTETDRGAVLLIDQRYGSEHYHTLLPAHWSPVTIRGQEEFCRELQSFWDNR